MLAKANQKAEDLLDSGLLFGFPNGDSSAFFERFCGSVLVQIIDAHRTNQ